MRKTHEWLWIAALAMAGVGWMFNLVAWFIDSDPYGMATWALSCQPLRADLLVYFGRCSVALLAAGVILVAVGLLEKESDEDDEPKKLSPQLKAQ